MEIFNEQKLRAEIAKTWGEYGAHIKVYDMLLKKANVVLPQANVSGQLPNNLTLYRQAKRLDYADFCKWLNSKLGNLR